LPSALHGFLQRYPRSYLLSLGVALCFFTSMNILTAPLPLYVTHLGGSAVAVGLAVGLFAGFALLSRAPVGWLADRVYRWWLLLAGCGIYLVASLAYLTAHTVPAVLAIRAFHGIGIAAFSTGYTTLAADLAPDGRRGEALGLAGTAGPIALLFAPALGDWVRIRFGYAPAFALAALAALGALVLLAWLPRRSGQKPQAARQLPSTPTGQQGARSTIVLAMVACGVAQAALFGFLPNFAVERNQLTAGPFFTAYALALILARIFLGGGSDRWGRRRVIVPSLALVAFSLWVLAATRNWMWMVGAGLLSGVGLGAAGATLEAASVDSASPERRGRAVNAVFLGFDLGIAAGSVAWGGVAQTLGYGPMFGVVGALGFFFAAVFAMWYRE